MVNNNTSKEKEKQMKNTMKNIWEYTKYPLAGIGIVFVILAGITGVGTSILILLNSICWFGNIPVDATIFDKLAHTYLIGFPVLYLMFLNSVIREWMKL